MIALDNCEFFYDIIGLIKVKKKIIEPYRHIFEIFESGLVGIFVSVRCKAKGQDDLDNDEDLRVEINGLSFRENSPKKNIQRFNIAPAFNGSKLRGLKKKIIFLTVLKKGENVIDLIPQESAFVESIEIKEFSNNQNLNLLINEKAEDGDRRPWITLVLVDLPLKTLGVDLITRWHYRDGDDVKLIIDGDIQKNKFSIFNKNWLWASSVFKKILKKEEHSKIITTKLSQGIHYIEFWADKTPVLYNLKLDIRHSETIAEEKASNIIKKYSNQIKLSAQELSVDPVVVGAVIYQEQSTNVNFVDTLSDYVGGLLSLNTSIGIGQVRVKTAEGLEKHYSELNFIDKDDSFIDSNMARVEKLKDPFLNIKYVVAKIHFSLERWREAGFDLSNKPEILGTLYNIEDVDDPIKPHIDSKANEFGKGVGKIMRKLKVC